jgi:hypothetical protein
MNRTQCWQRQESNDRHSVLAHAGIANVTERSEPCIKRHFVVCIWTFARGLAGRVVPKRVPLHQ